MAEPSSHDLGSLDEFELQQLAQYNAERSRGIVHTLEWKVRMAALQRRFGATPWRPPNKPAKPFWRFIGA